MMVMSTSYVCVCGFSCPKCSNTLRFSCRRATLDARHPRRFQSVALPGTALRHSWCRPPSRPVRTFACKQGVLKGVLRHFVPCKKMTAWHQECPESDLLVVEVDLHRLCKMLEPDCGLDRFGLLGHVRLRKIELCAKDVSALALTSLGCI